LVPVARVVPTCLAPEAPAVRVAPVWAALVVRAVQTDQICVAPAARVVRMVPACFRLAVKAVPVCAVLAARAARVDEACVVPPVKVARVDQICVAPAARVIRVVPVVHRLAMIKMRHRSAHQANRTRNEIGKREAQFESAAGDANALSLPAPRSSLARVCSGPRAESQSSGT
jgi:hypothetical protein